MDFGVFDHIDTDGQNLRDFYAARLRIVEQCERAGFHAYHVAEHHGTPLGLAPSPGLFLSAAFQRTTKMRLGPLVFILPLYDPLRLIEEIAMLDQMSGGRLELGVGRGTSPLEGVRRVKACLISANLLFQERTILLLYDCSAAFHFRECFADALDREFDFIGWSDIDQEDMVLAILDQLTQPRFKLGATPL